MSTSFVPVESISASPTPTNLVFNTSDTFEKASYVSQGYRMVEVHMIGPGGGGGGGAFYYGDVSPSFGGNGGGGGGESRRLYTLSSLPSSVDVFVLDPGIGGSGAIALGFDGEPGTTGGYCSFFYGGQTCFAYGGQGGAGGSNEAPTAQALGGAGEVHGSPGGVAELSSNAYPAYKLTSAEDFPGTLIDFNGGDFSYAAGGGGAGGSVAQGGPTYISGAGAGRGTNVDYGTYTSGTGPGNPGNSGLAVPTDFPGGGGGGGGGGVSTGLSAGRVGGDPGNYGAGGGGGGAAWADAPQAGYGADGAPGIVVLYLF